MSSLHKSTLAMHHMTTNITTKVSGLDKVKDLFHIRDTLDKTIDSKINVHADDSAVKHVENSADRLSDKLKHLRGNDHLKNSFNGTRHTIKGAGSDTSRLGHKFDGVATKAETLGGRVKRVGGAFKTAFATGVVASFASNAYNDLKPVIEKGWQLNMAGLKAKNTWQHVGLSHGQTSDMVNQLQDIRDTSDVDMQSITTLQERFYTLTGSAGRARSLTREVIGFGKATNMSNQALDRMGKSLPRMFSASKVRAQQFSRAFGQAPALVGELAKKSGKTRKQFLALVNSGQMTGAELKKDFIASAHDSGKAWNEYTKTAGGRIQYLKGLGREAEQSGAKGLTGSFVKGLTAISSNNKGLKEVHDSLGRISNTLGKKVGNYAGKAITFMIKNQKPLMRTASALLRITGIIGKTVWKSFSSIITGIFGSSRRAGNGINSFANALNNASKHTRAITRLTHVLMVMWGIRRITRFVKAVRETNHELKITETVSKVATGIKAFTSALRVGTTAQSAFDAALAASGISETVLIIDGIVAGVAALGAGLVELYRHCTPVRNVMRAIGHIGASAFKAIWNGVKAVGKLVGAVLKWYFKPYIKVLKALGHVASGVFHKLGGVAHGVFHKAGHFIGGVTDRVNKAAGSTTRSSRNAMRKTNVATRGYLSKSGKYYRHYHKGLTRISKASYKQRLAMRKHYSSQARASLKKYEGSYRKYQKRRSSLGRKYGKLRAMYSVKSLRLIERRFKRLRRNILKYTRSMYRGTRKYFRRIGRGSGKQFKGIYRSARRWLNRTKRVQVRDFRRMNKNSRRLLDGSIKRYVGQLRYRYKRQRFYDRQLIKQTRRTNTIMRKLPLGWVLKETKALIANWKRQRRSFVVHNRRMTKALVTHIHTMSHHLRNFSKSFNDIFDDLESNIYDKWIAFWKRMHNAAGKGINTVQAPLNTGASHLNGFVEAFGEGRGPLHAMPSVSYATGTGALDGVSSIRRPITQLTSAILNDDSKHQQETVLHPNGTTEKPTGSDVHKTLRPGDEVLNGYETKLMHALNPVHFASGTGFFSKLRHAITGSMSSSVTQPELYSHAKGKDNKHRLLDEMQSVMKSPGKVLSGMFGADPHYMRGYFDDVVQSAFSMAGDQAGSWWSSLMNLVNKELDSGGGSDSDFLNYAEKISRGKPYKWGGNGPGGFDCSGLVRQALDHYNVTKGGRVAGSEINAFPHISRGQAKPGDLVGNHDHIGIVSDNGAHHYYSAFNYDKGIQNFPLDQAHWTTGNPQMIFARVPQLEKASHDSDNKAPSVKASGAVQRFVKNQEAPMLKWINKNLVPLEDFGDISGTAGAWTKPGTQAHHIAEDVFEAAEHIGMDAKHAAAVVGNAWHESAGFEHGLKVNQFDGGGGKGLFQFTGQGSKYGWSPMGQVKSIMANALGGSASNWEHSGGSPSSLAHSFETTFERGSIPAFASRDAAANRAYQMFASDEATPHARGGHFHKGELMKVGEEGEELIKPDFSGKVIPHQQSKQVINNSKRPVNVNQNVTVNIKDGSKASANRFVKILQHYDDKLAEKFNGGGDYVY